MVVSRHTKSQRIVDSLLNDQQINNKVNTVEKNNNKPKNGKKNKKEKAKTAKKALTVQTQNNSNQIDEFITATPDYLSAQTYEIQKQQQLHQQQYLQQQQQQKQQQPLSPIYNDLLNVSPIPTDYYSIYNQLASNTLLDNVLNYHGQLVNAYYSPVSNASPIYSAYSDFERSPYPLYSPNLYSYPLSAPVNFTGYVLPYEFGLDEQPVKPKKSNKKNVKKQAIRDHQNHEQQVIDQFHKNISENKPNKIAGKKKMNKNQKEIRRHKRVASKNLNVNTGSPNKAHAYENAQVITKNTIPSAKSEYRPLFNMNNVFPSYSKPENKANTKKASTNNMKEPDLQYMRPGVSRNTPSQGNVYAKPEKNTNLEKVLDNELTLSFLNNVYNGFTWESTLLNSTTNHNISFITRRNPDHSNEITAWKDSQTPGQKYSIASLLAMTYSPYPSGSLITERRSNRKELYDYWSKMARRSMMESAKNGAKPVNHADDFIHRVTVIILTKSTFHNTMNEIIGMIHWFCSIFSRFHH